MSVDLIDVLLLEDLERQQMTNNPNITTSSIPKEAVNKKVTNQKTKEQSMANEIVNPQITDSVTETNTMVVGVTPSQITTNLMQMGAHINGLSMQNAAIGQKQTNMIYDASTTQGLSTLYEMSTSVDAQAVDTINRSNDMSKIIDALAIGETLKPAPAPTPKPAYGG